MSNSHPDQRTIYRLATLGEVFRPSGPITTQDLFTGRISQLASVADICGDPGRHGVIYGERGVGKTSLAAVSTELQKGRGKVSLRVNCDPNDDFTRIWRKVADEFDYFARTASNGVKDALDEAGRWLTAEDPLAPDLVRQALRRLTEMIPTVIFLDEFDRVPPSDSRRLFSDLLKSLSDHLIPATIILVGVADDVDALVTEHESVTRALAQIRMPRMTRDEIDGIIAKGLTALELGIDDFVRGSILTVPQGLPHYAHLLAQESARDALLSGHETISRSHFFTGLQEALKKVDQTMARAYHNATASSRQKTMIEEVLIACALAPTDDLGYFAPSDVRGPLSKVMGQKYEIPQFANHLGLFCTERGPVLERRGGERRWRYRFKDPMMQPYAILKGMSSGKIKGAAGDESTAS